MKSLTTSTIKFNFKEPVEIERTSEYYTTINPITNKKIFGESSESVKHTLADELLTEYYYLYVVHQSVSNEDIDNRKQAFNNGIIHHEPVQHKSSNIKKQKYKINHIDPIIGI